MKIGLIGYGYWGGGFVARNIARVADLAVIVDPDPSRMVSASEAWAPWGVRVASEPEVAFDLCDAVWIATPVQTHVGLIWDALQAGVHVMCEKPFVMDSGDAELLSEEAKSRGLAIMAGHLSLFTSAHARACENRSIGGKVASLRQTDRASISDHSVAWGLGPHDIAALIDLYGMPESVVWAGNTHRTRATLVFENGTTATASFDWLGSGRERSFKIDGKEFANTPDEREPLLAEAQYFAWLCEEADDDAREYQRSLIRLVTAVLERAERLVCL